MKTSFLLEIDTDPEMGMDSQESIKGLILDALRDSGLDNGASYKLINADNIITTLELLSDLGLLEVLYPDGHTGVEPIENIRKITAKITGVRTIKAKRYKL